MLAAAVGVFACSGGRTDQPSPSTQRGLDSAMTAVHDSAGPPDSTVGDTSTGR
jgi:hypothetical protein